MGKRILAIAAVVLAGIQASGQTATGYEWWFDNDVSSAQSGDLDSDKLTLTPDLTDLADGIHYFNLRLNNSDGDWGAPYRRMFMTVGSSSGAVAYEYWIDNDTTSKTEKTITTEKATLQIDLSNKSRGLHYFNLRLRNNQTWGSIYRQAFLTTPTISGAVGYEYWLDDNYAARQEGSVAEGENSYAVSLEGVKKGLHRFNYRMKTADDEWGSVYSQLFFHTSGNTPFSNYEYWFDKDYDNKVSGTTATNPAVFNVDMGSLDKSGTHFFNLRTRDGDGEWGSVYRKVIIFYEDVSAAPLLGYRHSLNGEDLGYVTLSAPTSGSLTFTVDLPEKVGVNLTNMEIAFDGDNLSFESMSDVDYRVQIQSELGWAPPTDYAIEVNNSFSTTAEVMAVPSSLSFEKPGFGEFKAVKFETDGRTLYLRTDRAAAMDIYLDGERVMSLTPEELLDTKETELAAGTYYAVIYDVAEGDGNVTFHLMDTDNQVPTPVMNFDKRYADRGYLTISCSRADAEIHYTIDNAELSESSDIYNKEEEIEILRNCTVRAFAVVPGLDLDPSEVATLVIDSFVVNKPDITFDTENLYVVITPDGTEGVRTYYTTDGSEPTESDELLFDGNPINVSGDVTILAKSFKEGYNPSETTKYEYKHSVYKTLAPIIAVSGTRVKITGQTTDSHIYYAIDNSDASSFELYDDEFDVSGNCTIYAQARSAGRFDSDVVSEVVGGLTVKKPDVRFDTGLLRIVIESDTMEGVTTRYTTDGSEPTVESDLYTEPIIVSGDTTILAKSFKDGYNPSETTKYEYKHSVYKTLPPLIEISGNTVTLKVQTEGSDLYYSTESNNPEDFKPYTVAFAIEENSTVYAQARKEGMFDSDIERKTISDTQCGAVRAEYDGRYVTLTCDTEEAIIYYTFNDGSPSNGTRYSGKFDAGGTGTLRIMARKPGFNDSDITEHPITVYTDETHAETTVAGALSEGFEWYPELPGEVEEYAVEGPVDESDLALIKGMSSLRHLNLEKAKTAALPDSAFAGTGLVTVSLPETMLTYGDSVFAGCSQLCAIIWNSGDATIDENLTAGVTNPNLLLYLSNPGNNGLSGNAARNIVNKGQAWTSQKLTLSHGEPFHAPIEFTAAEAIYEREFTKHSGVDGEVAGWETLTVPFDVQTVSDANGEIHPFAAETGDRRFWLHQPTGTGWDRAGEIKAYRPYLTAMPNHPWYDEQMNIRGKVTFKAENALVGATPEFIEADYKNGLSMSADYLPVAAADDIYVINDETYGDHLPGGVFAAGIRDAKPFECHITGESHARYLPIFDTSELEWLTGDSGIRIWCENKEICIRSGVNARIRIHDTVGRLVRVADIKAGETTRVSDLNKGVYLVGDKKLYVK